MSWRPLAMAAAVAVAVSGLALPAVADPTDGPSQEQVDAARASADAKTGTVAGIQGRLDSANARLEAAELAASQAAEAANGAVWRLQLAETAATKAAAAEKAARRALVGHQAAYTDLIARTYEQQPELHALSALTSQARPEAMVDSASTTYQLNAAMGDIEAGYTKAAATAKTARQQASDARAEAAALADQAVAARNQAQSAADGAAAEADRVAAEKSQLLTEIARLQNISVDLATQRQSALEEQERRAASAAAQAAAEAAAQDAGKATARRLTARVPRQWPTTAPTAPTAPAEGALLAGARLQRQLRSPPPSPSRHRLRRVATSRR